MFEFVRKHTKWMMLLMFLLIIPSFALMGIDGFKSMNAGGESVAKVGSYSIKQAEWDNAHKNEVDSRRAQMPNLDPKLLDTPLARYATLEKLVRERVLSEAADKALANVPRFDGRTLVALDGSGSMSGRPLEIGSLFAAVLAKANKSADVMVFSNDAEFIPLNRRDSTLTLAREIARRAPGGGTNFHAVFEQAKAGYDRVVILSDMQGWVGHYAPTTAFEDWKRRTGSDPRVFSFDLAGLGTLQFPERNVFCLAGFSDKALQTMKFLEEDKNALIREIEAIPL